MGARRESMVLSLPSVRLVIQGSTRFLATREQLSLIGWMRNSGCRGSSTTLSRLMVFGLTVELSSWR